LETTSSTSARSPPSRGRGLKRTFMENGGKPSRVAPFAGAWIETQKRLDMALQRCVAPFAGAWIEIPTVFNDKKIRRVLFENEWHFAVVDLIAALTNSDKPRDY